MAIKTDFHDHLISVLDHHQLFMAMKKDSWVHHEYNFHGIFIKLELVVIYMSIAECYI